jgi:phospho-N-acetylmuramoyl-pentapeptide-transferase
MLLLLSEWLEQYVRAFNVFGYITLRAVLATMTSLVISFMVGPRMITWLTRMKIGQSVRDDGRSRTSRRRHADDGRRADPRVDRHHDALWGNLTNRFVWVVLLVMTGFGIVGWSTTGARSCIAIRRVCRQGEVLLASR